MLSSRGIIQILRNKIEERKKETLRSDLVDEAYKDLVYDKIEISPLVIAKKMINLEPTSLGDY